MAASLASSVAPAIAVAPIPWPKRLLARAKEAATPYHLTLLAVIGLISVVFAVVIGVLLLISTNFNILAWME
jgi:hypothetical protein